MPFAAFLDDITSITSAVTSVRHVTMDGTVVTDLVDAVVTGIEWELNGPGSATFTMHPLDPDAASLDFPAEVQFWRNGRCLWWGYIARYNVNRDTVTFTCTGLLHYFDARHFGKANRTNYVTNGSFESDGTGWTVEGVTASYPTVSATHPVIHGTKSALLDQAVPGVDTHLKQEVPYTIWFTANGDLLTLVAWYYISPTVWGGGAYQNRGLYLELRDSTTDEIIGANVHEIDDDTPRGSWRRAELELWVPPYVVAPVLNVRLYAPATLIVWDAVSLTAMESLSLPQADQTYIAQRWVNYAQDLDFWVHGKSNLNIAATETTCPPTGVVRDSHKQFAEHDNIGRSLIDFTQMDDGFDISVEHTATARTFHTWFPSKGVDRTGAVTIANAMLAEGPGQFSFDGEQATNSVVVLGDGYGPDREEGAATDLAAFAGVTFEKVVSARPGTTINDLDPIAAEHLQAGAYPSSATVTVHEPSALLLETVAVGDLLDCNIDHGRWQIQGTHRVVAIRFQPDVEALTFELNPELS